MRVDPDLYAGIDASMQQSEQSLETAVNQLSSGKRVAKPSDDPRAFTADIQTTAASAAVDTYTRNGDSVMVQARAADSALSSVVTSLTEAISIGAQGGNSTLSSTQRLSLVQQVQGLLSSVVSQANTSVGGTALFAGTAATATPFVLDASSANGVRYQGNDDSNQAQVGQSFSVTVNIPGDQVFTSTSGNVLGALQSMVTALQSGSASDIADAASSLNAAIGHIDQIRSVYGNTVHQLTAENEYLSQETISLTTQEDSLVGIDTATAATNLTQAQTAQSAVLAMAAKILPTSLLNYLQN